MLIERVEERSLAKVHPGFPGAVIAVTIHQDELDAESQTVESLAAKAYHRTDGENSSLLLFRSESELEFAQFFLWAKMASVSILRYLRLMRDKQAFCLEGKEAYELFAALFRYASAYTGKWQDLDRKEREEVISAIFRVRGQRAELMLKTGPYRPAVIGQHKAHSLCLQKTLPAILGYPEGRGYFGFRVPPQ